MATTYNRRVNVFINGKEAKNDIASIRNELKKLEIQQAHMDIGSTQYNKLGNEIRKLKGIISDHRDSLRVASSQQDKMAASGGKVSGMFGKLFSSAASLAGGLGLAVGAMELVKGVFTATDTLGDKLEETVGGLKQGFSYLAKSVATMDFSNFFDNMWEAVKAGQEYARTMDSIMDRTRAMGILESKDRNRIAELDIKQKYVTKPLTERIDAAKEILTIEQANADRRMAIAKDTETAELRNASIMTGLTQNRVKELMTLMETNKNLTTEIETYQAAQGEFTSFSSTPASLAAAKNIINSTSKEIQNASKDLEKFGKLADTEKDRLAQTIVAVGDANSYFNESTKKTQTRMAKLNQGILEEEDKIGKGAEVTKNALQLVQDAIQQKENELYNAIGARKPALVEKASLELKALKELEKTYQMTYDRILSGYDEKAIIEKLTPHNAAKVVKGEKKPLSEQDQASLDVLNRGQDRQNFNIDQFQQADQDAFAAEEEKAAMELELFEQKETAKKELVLQLAQEANDAIFQIIQQRNQDELNATLSKLEKERQDKLSVEGLTKAQIQTINDQYDAREKEAKRKSWKSQHAADMVQAVTSGALAVLNALATGGAAAPFLAIAAGVSAGAQLAIIAAQKMPEFAAGGYTMADGSNSTPAGIVHANEYVIPASGVKNPKLRPFLELLETSRLSGNLPTLNPALYGLRLRGFADGGYVSNSIATAKEQEWMDRYGKERSRSAQYMDRVQMMVLNKLTKAVDELQRNGVKGKWVLNDFEKIQTDKKNIEKATEM